MRVIAALILAASLALAACGGSDKAGTEPSKTAPRQSHAAERSIQPSSAAARELDQLSTAPAAGDDAGIDFATYDDTLAGMVELLNRYWAEAEPDDYSPPSDIIAYDPAQPDAASC